MDDFEAIKAAEARRLLGMYESAIFEKTVEGDARIINTDATERTFGAKVGAVTGGVIGLLFPPSILAAAAMGTGIGAHRRTLRRGLKKDDIESMADLLNRGSSASWSWPRPPSRGLRQADDARRQDDEGDVDVDAEELAREIEDEQPALASRERATAP